MIHPPYHTRRAPFPDWSRLGLSAALLSTAFGCSALKFNQNETAATRDPLLTPSSSSTSIDQVKGPLERTLLGKTREQSVSATIDTAGFREYEAARELYEAGNYADEKKAFKTISEEHAVDESGFFRKRKLQNLFKSRSELEANYYDNPLVEDSLFMLAESRYQLRKYPGAEDIYLQLLKQYPNTRHLDQATQRLFDIALTWMQFKGTTSEEVQVASFSDTGRSAKPEVVSNADYQRPSFFNMTDRSRPWSDTEGRALEALKAIWLNDPTGPLADDALMLTASHYLRIGRYAEAAETFRLLREEFPNSPHIKDAFILGSYVTQASYQGASYDEQSLREARQLKTMALNTFPNLTPEEKARIEQEIYKLDDATVARSFEAALFWLNKGRFDAVEMYCHNIVNTYPDSKYAGKARGLLKRLPEFRQRNTLVLAMQGITANDIESIDDPAANGIEDQLPPQATLPDQSPPREEATPQETPRQPPRYFPSLEMPKLKPIPVPRLWPGREEPELESAPPFPGGSGNEADPGRVNLTLGTE